MWLKEEPRTENDSETITPLVPEKNQDFSDQQLHKEACKFKESKCKRIRNKVNIHSMKKFDLTLT